MSVNTQVRHTFLDQVHISLHTPCISQPKSAKDEEILEVLLCTSGYFEVHLYTSRYFEVLLGTLRYFDVLCGTLRYF